MLIPNHPDEERLAALASLETDATADAALTSHVASCHRCTGIIEELGALRVALAELPDVAPSRPLRLLPPVEAEPAPVAGGLAGWARRFFAPVLASGAALALVGAIGTSAPALTEMASSPEGAGGAAPAQELAAPAASEPAAAPQGEPSVDSLYGAGATDNADARSSAREATGEEAFPDETAVADSFSFESGGEDSARDLATADSSPWPMVLVAGIALMVGAVLFRWILVPRAA